MRPFGWEKWRTLHRRYIKSGWHSLERWGLVYLHSRYALNNLARAVAGAMGKAGKQSSVSVQSIWIDGTPQVSATAMSGKKVKCELADLLFILNEQDPTGRLLRRSGLLVQAKVARKYNELPAGSSTAKERRLLEDLNRAMPIDVYRGMATTSSKIGSYVFGGNTYGMKDCSRYVLMPKGLAWSPIRRDFAPFQVGWPSSKIHTELRPPIGLVEAIQRVVITQSIGRQVHDNTPSLSCDWSRLVWDLLGDFDKVVMSGYGGQKRIHTSAFVPSNVLHFMASDDFSTSGSTVLRNPIPPNQPIDEEQIAFDRPPSISVLVISIRSSELGRR